MLPLRPWAADILNFFLQSEIIIAGSAEQIRWVFGMGAILY